jgi:hypothetical protein
MNTIKTNEEWYNFNPYQVVYVGPPSEVLIALQDAKSDLMTLWNEVSKLERIINEQNLRLQNQW